MSDLFIYRIIDSARMTRYVVTDVIKDEDFLKNHSDAKLQSDEYIDACYPLDGFLTQELGDKVSIAVAGLDRLAALENLVKRLKDIDWCIGYELTEAQMIELDDIRSEVCKIYE
jgi:hypothetical protein